MEGPILLIGASGMLGRAWREVLDRAGMVCDAPTHSDLDISQTDSIQRYIDGHHRVVVNCAAWTDVDGAEAHEAQAHQINGTAVGTLADRCAATGSMLVHYSTDYIFDGCGDTPYPVDHPTSPVNAYGRSKLAGEQLIEQSGCRHLLIRTSWLYAPWGKNFVGAIAGLLSQRESIKVVDDQQGRPTSSQHLARVSMGLIDKNAAGAYHVTDGGACTWYGFAREIARQLNSDCRVEPCTTAEFPRPAARPAYSVLDLSRAQAVVGPMTPWEDSLAVVLASMASQG